MSSTRSCWTATSFPPPSPTGSRADLVCATWPKGTGRWEGKSAWWVSHRANSPPIHQSNQGKRTSFTLNRFLGPCGARLAFSWNHEPVGGCQGTIVLRVNYDQGHMPQDLETPFVSLTLALTLSDHTVIIHSVVGNPGPQHINNPCLSCGFFTGYFQYSPKLWRLVDRVRVEPEFRETLCPKPRQGRR